MQTLKREISKARVRIMESLIDGPAGLEYLKKAFANRYGSPINAPTSLPLTRQWLSSVRVVAAEEWDEYRDSQSTMTSNVRLSQGLPPTTLRTGGSILTSSKMGSPTFSATGLICNLTVGNLCFFCRLLEFVRITSVGFMELYSVQVKNNQNAREKGLICSFGLVC